MTNAMPAPPLVLALLVAARSLGLAMTAPGWTAVGLGWRLRLGVAIALTAGVLPLLSTEITSVSSTAELAMSGLAELMAGMLLGLGAALLVAAARQAGDLLALQAGLNLPTVLVGDGSDEAVATPLGQLYGLLAAAVFVSLDGPLAVVETLAGSYRVMPLGGFALADVDASTIAGPCAEAFELLIRLATPPTLALLASGIAVGLIARTTPSIAGLTLGQTVRFLVALAAIALSLTIAVSTLTTAWARWSAGVL